ncbi:MAG: 3,4-dihydroxy-2-butanone-4-phosphate synthase [Proteobacteria bacterium]|nr:3,4-dihydroxy-2-butanone-4-phosphate synthase [Pseudomonadota bacterium]
MDVNLISKILREIGYIFIIDDLDSFSSIYVVADTSNIKEDTVTNIVNISRGVVCASISEKKTRELNIPRLPLYRGNSPFNFYLSIEARHDVTTGISSSDRATTLQALTNTKDAKLDLVTPGHIFPIVAKNGGVLVRSGIAEAALDVLGIVLKQSIEVSAFSHCLDAQGSLATLDSLKDEINKSAVVSISDLIKYRLNNEILIDEYAKTTLPTANGIFRAHCYKSKIDGTEHLALIKGKLPKEKEADKSAAYLVRVQSENRYNDLFNLKGNLTLDKIQKSLAKIDSIGEGVFVYIRHPRNIFTDPESEHSFQNPKQVMSLREYGIGAQILKTLGIESIKLLSSNNKDIVGIDLFNLKIEERILL